jgi:hypothetical protein
MAAKPFSNGMSATIAAEVRHNWPDEVRHNKPYRRKRNHRDTLEANNPMCRRRRTESAYTDAARKTAQPITKIFFDG